MFWDCIPSPLTCRNVSLCVCSSGTRYLYKRARDYARRLLATWSIMWSTPHPACPSSPPITNQHRPHRLTASAWTPHRKSHHCWTLDEITNDKGELSLSFSFFNVILVLSFLPLYSRFPSTFFKAVSLWEEKKHQPLTWWQGNRFHCKLTAS